MLVQEDSSVTFAIKVLIKLLTFVKKRKKVKTYLKQLIGIIPLNMQERSKNLVINFDYQFQLTPMRPPQFLISQQSNLLHQ